MDRYNLKIRLKTIIYTVASSTWWLLGMKMIRTTAYSHPRILTWHKVSDKHPNMLNVSTALFKKQMEYLARNSNVVPLASIVESLKTGKTLPPGTVAITFDDGYLDNFTNAYPVLKHHGLPATIFLPAGYIGSGRILPHDSEFDSEFNSLLSWEQVREMSRNGIEFGGHTVNHTILTGLNRYEAEIEIRGSAEIIQRKTGLKPRFFAYPVGTESEFNKEHEKLVEDSGYEAAFTGMSGVVRHGTNPYAIPRCNVEPGSFFLFKRTVDGSMDIVRLKDMKLFKSFKNLFNRFLGTPE